MKKFLIVLMIVAFGFTVFGNSIDKGVQKFTKICESNPLFNYKVIYVTDLCVDHKESVFILDSNSRRILKFSPELKYIKSFGKKGSGPGEFNRAFKISLDKSGNIYVVEDFLKIIKFSGKGRFIMEKKISGFVTASSGKVITYPIFAGMKLLYKSGYLLQIFNIDNKKILKEYKIQTSPNYAVSTGRGYLAPTIPFVGGHSFVETNGKYCLFGEGEKFNVRLVDKNGKIISSVKKDYPKKILAQKEREMLIDDLMEYFPGKKERPKFEKLLNNYKVKNYIHKLLLSEKYFFVFSVPEDICVKNRFPVEIYNFKGVFIKKIYFPKVPYKILGNYAYVIEKKELEDDEEIKIVKYRIDL